MSADEFLHEHWQLTRRYFLRMGVVGALASPLAAPVAAADTVPAAPDKPKKPDKGGARHDPYFTPSVDFRDVSRGKPVPHSLPEDKQREVGLTRDTWRLEVLADPEKPARLGKPMTKTDGTALDFAGLMQLAETHAVRFPKVMTCLNLGCPLGMGLWEGVPLRDVVWLTQPRENLRRVFYYGYHNDEPAQMFRSSLPIGRVRIVVPEAYGFKSVKWLTHVFLTNLAHANDTYADANNDVDSPMKTFAATLLVPKQVRAGEPIPVSGYAQVGISGLTKVQVSIEPTATERQGDPYFTTAPWVDAELLPIPLHWGDLPDGKIPADTLGFDASGQPRSWPLRLTNAHWAAVLPALPAGEYTLRSRTIDEKGYAQPLPRPFKKSGHAAIESIEIAVKE